MTPSWTVQTNTQITQAIVWEGGDCLCLARIRNIDGTYLQQSQLAGILLIVWDRNTLVRTINDLAVSIGGSVFNTLQMNVVTWPVDAIGYNFLFRVTGANAFPNVADYRASFIFTLLDGTSYPVMFDLSSQYVPMP